MLCNVDTKDEENCSDSTFILISSRSGEPLSSNNAASNRVDVRPTSQRRAVSPAALFSAVPDYRWRPRLSRIFRTTTYLFINIFVLSPRTTIIALCIGYFPRRITPTHYLNYYTAQRTGVNATVQPSLISSVAPTRVAHRRRALWRHRLPWYNS